MKQKIKNIITYLGLGEYVDRCRFNWIHSKEKKHFDLFKKNNPDIPLPEPFMIYETFRFDYERYWNSGKEDALWIINAVSPFMNLNGKKILDWGCGPARVIRHLPKYIDHATFYGADYNPSYIKWNSNNILNVNFSTNNLQPPLEFENNELQFIYAISIFTHLSESMHYAWIDEIHRILDIGGIFLFTTHGDVTLPLLSVDEKHSYQRNKLVVRGNVKEGNRMYSAYHPPAFIHSLIENKFKILKHEAGTPQKWGYAQDLWIIQKL